MNRPSRLIRSSREDVRRQDAVLRRYFACLDAEDWTGMREIWHPEGRLRAVGARPRHGREAVLGYFGRLFRPWTQHTDTPTRIVHAKAFATAEVRFDGVTQDGRAVTFEAIDVFDLRDGLISGLSNWYDLDYARRVLSGAAAGDDGSGE